MAILIFMAGIGTTNTPVTIETINKFLTDWTGIVVAIIGGILSYITFFYNQRRDKFNGLSEAFRILNDNVHREARRVVHTQRVTSATRKILGFDETDDEAEVKRVSGDIVATDMEQIGTMARNKLFDKDIFLQRYSSSILMEWRELGSNILEQRSARQTKDYGGGFEYLKKAAVSYRRKEYREDNPEGKIEEYLKNPAVSWRRKEYREDNPEGKREEYTTGAPLIYRIKEYREDNRAKIEEMSKKKEIEYQLMDSSIE